MKERVVAIFERVMRPLIEGRQRVLAREADIEANPDKYLDIKAREFLRNALIETAGLNGNDNGAIDFDPPYKNPLSWANDEQKHDACALVKKWLEKDHQRTLGQERIDAAMERLETRILK